MKHLTMSLFLVASCALSMVAENKDIQVYGQNDELLGTVKGVTDVKLNNNTITLVKSNGETSYDNVKYFTLTKSDVLSLTDVMEISSPVVSVLNGNVVVDGMSGSKATVQVVNTAGVVIGQANAQGASSVTIPLKGYKGIVIVNVNLEKLNKVYKLACK